MLISLGPDELEDPTRDLASFACLLARTSAKDIRDEANKHKHGRFHSKVLLLRISLHFPASVQPSVPLTNNVLVYCWATLIRLPTKVRIYD
jgi:hypothetical protein